MSLPMELELASGSKSMKNLPIVRQDKKVAGGVEVNRDKFIRLPEERRSRELIVNPTVSRVNQSSNASFGVAFLTRSRKSLEGLNFGTQCSLIVMVVFF